MSRVQRSLRNAPVHTKRRTAEHARGATQLAVPTLAASQLSVSPLLLCRAQKW